MKMKFTAKILCLILSVVALTVIVNGKGFEKSKTYTAGTFNDVPETSWYAKEVKSAYELGLVAGKGEGKFAPSGNVTVAEGITFASRVHAIYNGKEIAKTEGKWYDMYVKYATDNGLIEEGQFTNFDRNIMRYEMAVMFAKTMSESAFVAKNAVKAIPDVNSAEEYHDELMLLYNAGVLMGSTEYGDFLATNAITRSETAAIINRVAIPENRLSKTLKEYGNRDQAVYLMDYHAMTRVVRDRAMIASGWKYENTIDFSRDDKDKSSNILSDLSDNGHVAIHRDVTTQTCGVVCLEYKSVDDAPGYSMVISDIDGNNMFTLRSNSDKTFTVIGDVEQTCALSFVRGARNMYFEFDLDSRKAKIVSAGKDVGVYDMSSKAEDISRVSFVTGDDEVMTFTLNEIYMYVNYRINDSFRTTPVGSAPYGWNCVGDVTVQTVKSDLDTNSVRLAGESSAVKKFDGISGKFVYETFVKVPSGQGMVVSLSNGGEKVISVNAANGEFKCGEKFVKTYTSNIWSLIRIEGDTEKKTAVIKINGKECLTVPFEAETVDSVEIASVGKGYCYFDDVEMYNVYDYADYVPMPVPVTDDEWHVGMSVCSLWREGTHYGWDCISPYDEATPVIGYYDEGLSEVADWEIKMLVEHGYDFQHFCWYVGDSDDGIKEPRLGDALHNGFMNAEYSHMQDFMLMWENNGYNYTTIADFKRLVWDYWCDWYFCDDRYFTIDNKPVLTIYLFNRFIEDMGGEENAIEAIKFMREDIKKLGYDDMIILFCNNGSNKNDTALMKKLGGDAFICYNFGEDSFNPDYQRIMMNAAYKNGYISLVPSISVGFNDIGWTETRTPNATPEAYQEVLEWSRDIYMPKIDKRESEDWKSRFVIGCTWNEFGEGHYIMPSNVCGFGYIDANRSVFSSVAGKDDSAHFDVEPTINQKARLGYLYPNRTQLIRRTYWYNEAGVDYSKLETVKGWNFENKADSYMWNRVAGTTEPVYSATENALVGTSTSGDPIITLIKTEENYIDADKTKYLKVRIKYDSDVVTGVTLYFKTETYNEYAQVRSVSKTTGGDGEYADYYLDLSSNRYWEGTVTEIRFDPMTCEGKYFIKSIEFLGAPDDATAFVIDVDGKQIKTDYDFVKKENGEVFVAGNPTDGFYSLHNFYTEWNRYDGKLMLKTGTGHIFNFTVGSDVALVDGKEKKMASPFDVFDGLPYIPMTFVYKNAGIGFKETKNGFTVKIRDGNISDEISKRVPYEYEFNVMGDLEGWGVSAATAIVSAGNYIMTALPVTAGAPDPKMQVSSTAINASLYKAAEVRVKCSFENESAVTSPFTFYFATDIDMKLDERKTGKIYLKDLIADKDGYYTIYFDFSQHDDWKSTVTQIRFDPTNSMGIFEIDYIRLIMDPDAKAEMQAMSVKEEQRKKLLMAADDGKPFYIENPDAEDVMIKPLTFEGYTGLRIVKDDLKKGNHAFEHVPDGKVKNWAYTMIPTRFKPGVTYKVEFDIRVTKDHTGADVNNAGLSWNMRYTDVVNNTYKPSADHHASLGTFSTADGWQHVSFTHMISNTSVLRDTDCFAIFANPITLGDGSYRVIGYMIDNIEISVVS